MRENLIHVKNVFRNKKNLKYQEYVFKSLILRFFGKTIATKYFKTILYSEWQKKCDFNRKNCEFFESLFFSRSIAN